MRFESLPWLGGRKRTSRVAWLLLAGLGLHAAADGAALAGAAHHGAETLPMAVLVHRLPVGLLVWWLVGGRRRPVVAAVALVALAGATAGGFWVASQSPWTDGGFALVEAFVGGALLHVLRGPHEVLDHEHPSEMAAAPLAETVGVVLAVIAALTVPPVFEVSSDGGVATSLLHLALISAPALVLGYLLAGVIGVVSPRSGVRWASRGGPWGQSIRGTILGLPIPICSCGVVPVYAGLHRSGLPGAAGLAFLIATPELGIESFLLSFPLLGFELTMARVGAAAVLAILVGVWVGRSVPVTAPLPAPADGEHNGLRISEALHLGFSELLESTGPWIVAGLAVAALIEPSLLQQIAQKAPGPLTVLGFALLGIPLYVCSSGATPLAAALILAGISPGAALAFLLSGPATNVTTFGLLNRLHGRRTALLFGVVATAGAAGLGLLLDAMWSADWAPPSPGQAAESIGIVHWVALGVLAVAGARLVLLRGPVALVRSLFEGHAGAGGPTPSPAPAKHSSDCCS